jgi:excisionase family DNA binding protein
MSDPVINPFEAMLDAFRQIVREELAAAGNGNGHANGHAAILLTAETAAKHFDVPKTWILEAARRGEIQSVRVGHYVRFRPEDLEIFIKANRTS